MFPEGPLLETDLHPTQNSAKMLWWLKKETKSRHIFRSVTDSGPFGNMTWWQSSGNGNGRSPSGFKDPASLQRTTTYSSLSCTRLRHHIFISLLNILLACAVGYCCLITKQNGLTSGVFPGCVTAVLGLTPTISLPSNYGIGCSNK